MICVQELKLHLKGPPDCAKVHHKAPRKPGPRRRTRHCELRVARQKRLQPMEQLPPEYIVSSKKQHCGIPTLHYCVAVSADSLYSYAVKHSLVHKLEGHNVETVRYCGMLQAIHKLKQLSGAILLLEEPLWKADDSFLVARYSNYSYSYHMNKKGAPPDDRVFDIVRRELATTSTPKWYQIAE
ncbi:hypothetical protein EWM64_g4555 [Hericium alpestre]|uniref:Uncharacterized protein n=1 Tax=Hericium alpestre TaxID=135208 RepID=A0A4Z0A0Z4_9AGAM|nr:hypothetical protein EWM64_g4555 [Hericium alpestre]